MSDKWLYEQLAGLLQYPVSQDMIDYMKSIITNTQDLEDYMNTLLDFNNEQRKLFLLKLIETRKGSKPQLVNGHNSIKCDRVVCEQGPGPSHLGNLFNQDVKYQLERERRGSTHDVGLSRTKYDPVQDCSGEGKDFLNLGAKQSVVQKLQKVMDQRPPFHFFGYEDAIQHMNHLEHDQTSEKPSRVIDNESDHLSTDPKWLSQAEREKLKRKEEEKQVTKNRSQKDGTMALDIGLRKIVEAKPQGNIDLEIDEVQQESSNSKPSSDNNDNTDEVEQETSDSEQSSDKNNDTDEVQQEISDSEQSSDNNDDTDDSSSDSEILQNKNQDEEYLKNAEKGFCLSIHQPWASLILHGIKLHHGRSWCTPHRGHLWIASTARVPSESEIKDAEELSRTLDGSMEFPEEYPSRCLLGCVTLVDCLSKREYRTYFPDRECDTDYVLLCKDPISLPVLYGSGGGYNIYALPPGTHEIAFKHIVKANKKRIAKLHQK